MTSDDWPVRAYASHTVIPMSMRDDEAALEVFVRQRLAQLRGDAMHAGHVVLPEDTHPPSVKVQAVWIDPDPESNGMTWHESWARELGHDPNALIVLTEIPVLYNPDVYADETARLLEPFDDEEAEPVQVHPWVLVLARFLVVFGVLLVVLGVGNQLLGAPASIGQVVSAATIATGLVLVVNVILLERRHGR